MLKTLFLTVAMVLAGGSIWADDAARQLARDNSAFAFDLYHQLDGTPGNLFFSPYCISTALAMTQAGARGETATQMEAVLHFSLPGDRLPAAFAQLQGDLHEAQGDDKVTLAIANSIWPSDRYKFLGSYLHLLKASYGVELTPLDYTQTEAARARINTWVGKQTQDKIKDLIGPGALTPATKMTLVNAIYFYGKWLSPFEPKDTDSWPFQVGRGKTEKVPMMRQKADFRYADLGTLQVLELPYRGEGLSMLIVLPESKTGLSAIESGLSTATLGAWQDKLKKTKVIVRVPKFKITWGTKDLSAALKALGMKDAFGDWADFSGMDGDPHGLVIDGVLHKAFIDVKEEGTEAAAATAVGMVAAAVELSPVFSADHPFLFFIRENKTGTVLFLGRVTDPLAGGDAGE
jgi:serine protease inhibitor